MKARRNKFTYRNLDDAELGAILAALRLYQESRSRLPWNIAVIASDDGRFPPLSNEAIDKLCDVLNYDDRNSQIRIHPGDPTEATKS